MRFALAPIVPLVLAASCMPDENPQPLPPLPIVTVWADSIHAGDMIVMVPGTGSYQFLAAPIQAMGGTNPLVDVRANATVAGDAIVFEQAIAAAERAGISDADLEAGKVTFGLWGAGFTSLQSFDYLSYNGVQIHVAIIGGTNTCATGSIFGNLFNYNTTDANTDANSLYTDIQAYLAANPSPTGAPRTVTIASHSWGGALSEYLTMKISTIEAANGPLADGGGVAKIKFTIAAGVPGFILGTTLVGPGLRTFDEGLLYEIDRPDDPVHAMDPSGNGAGHQYSILIGDDFIGSYGVSTTELACAGVAGECGPPAPPQQ